MKLLSRIYPSLVSLINRFIDRHLVEIKGFPYTYRVLLKPGPLIKALRKNNMSERVDNIRLREGKIDSIVGRYNMATGEIDIDVKEIIFTSNVLDPKDIDERVTKTLAHELRHRWQRNHYGKFRILADKIAIFFGFLFVFCWWPISPIVLAYFRHAFNIGNWSVVVIPVGGYLIYRLLLFFLTISTLLAYRLCWSERDARRFAKQVVNDPEWKDVIEVGWNFDTAGFRSGEAES